MYARAKTIGNGCTFVTRVARIRAYVIKMEYVNGESIGDEILHNGSAHTTDENDVKTN